METNQYKQNENLYKIDRSPSKSTSDKTTFYDSVNSFFDEEIHMQKAVVYQLLSLIKERAKLRDKTIGTLDEAICTVHTAQANLHSPSYLDPFRNENQRISLEKMATNIKCQKDKEYQNYWSDTSKLTKDLLPEIFKLLTTERELQLLDTKYVGTTYEPSYVSGIAKYENKSDLYIPPRIP